MEDSNSAPLLTEFPDSEAAQRTDTWASGSQASTGGTDSTTAQQPTGPQQPIQSAGPGQTFLPLQTYPPPVYYVGSSYPPQGYLPQDPSKMMYPNFVLQPYAPATQPGVCFPPTFSQPNNPVVVQQQPTPVPTTAVVQSASGDNYLTLSVVMTLLVLILGGWPSLICTMAALLISFNARDDERRGNIAAARTKANISLGLNIAAVVFTIVVWSVVAIPVAVTVSAAKSTSPYTPPTPYCYPTSSSQYNCYTQYCNYQNYYYYSLCYYNSYYSYSSYSYTSSYSYNYYSQYCYLYYSKTCSG